MPRHQSNNKNGTRWGVLIFVALLLGAMAWIPSLPKRFATKILPAIFGEHANYGDLKIDPFKCEALFTDLVINQAAEFGPGILLESPEVTISFRRFPRIGEQIDVERLRFKSPIFTLLRNPRGEYSIPPIPNPKQTKSIYIGEISARNATLLYIDQIDAQTAIECISDQTDILLFNLRLSNQFPYDNLADEIHLNAPEILISSVGRGIRKAQSSHDFQIGHLSCATPFLTIEEDDEGYDGSSPVNLSFTNFAGEARGLILGQPSAPEVYPAKLTVQASFIQAEGIAPFGAFLKLGPLVGRGTQIQGDAHLVGLDINSLRFLYPEAPETLRLVTASIGGSHVDLHHRLRGKLQEMSFKTYTESPRGIRTESTIIYGDEETKRGPFKVSLAKVFISPDKAVAIASDQDRDRYSLNKEWRENIQQRADALFKKAKME